MQRKAAVRVALWQAAETPPGSKNGACIQRGNLGTWESQMSPWEEHRRGEGQTGRTMSPGVVEQLSALQRVPAKGIHK